MRKGNGCDTCPNPKSFYLRVRQEGMTPLHLAARYGHLPVLDCLKDNVSLSICSVKVRGKIEH